MSDSPYDPYENNINKSEKLFNVLQKLNSIKETAQLQGESEQFILGLLVSTDIVSAEIRGVSYQDTRSIDDPNQIPLL